MFCFLLKSQKELIGNFQSTFVFWAALLTQNTTTNVTLYTINSRSLQNRYGGNAMLLPPKFLYNWTNPNLKHRIKLQLIDEEA